MLEEGKRKFSGTRDADFVLMDGHKLDFPDNTFDTVVDTFGLCSFDNPKEVLGEMQRVCKEDGVILLLEHGRSTNHNWLSSHLDRKAELHHADWGCWWNRNIEQLVTEAGLEIVNTKKQNLGTTYFYVAKPKKQAE
eukprot:TRINITY_DN3216_c0_g1_i1.p1 TRINITY_DN3216_c0_g1~~TRINITY_DN3216_c0_g1_i1.p1  ORF type:complete len:136 (-),score=26.88 TRINITY_DN3216_c0_g1_i1:10-417(-)